MNTDNQPDQHIENEETLDQLTLEELADNLGFLPEEVALNREGKLSDRQRRQLRASGNHFFLIGGALSLLGSLCTFAVVVLVLFGRNKPGGFWLFALVMGLVSLLCLGWGSLTVRAGFKMRRPNVSTRYGIIKADEKPIRTSLFLDHLVVMDKFGLRLGYATYISKPLTAFGSRVCVYYVDTGTPDRPLLSAEPWQNDGE